MIHIMSNGPFLYESLQYPYMDTCSLSFPTCTDPIVQQRAFCYHNIYRTHTEHLYGRCFADGS
jgi:hypothetical protein